MTSDIQMILAPTGRFQPVPWERIPDLGLYMDQVVTFISRAYEPLYGEDVHGCLSASMINNYVKGRLIPRPSGKKYSRDQIALLLMIVVLKQTSTMEDIRRMLSLDEGDSVEALYTGFCRRFSRVIQSLRGESAPMDAPRSALDFAILSSGYAAGCAAVLKYEETKEDVK